MNNDLRDLLIELGIDVTDINTKYNDLSQFGMACATDELVIKGSIRDTEYFNKQIARARIALKDDKDAENHSK